jgi:hypothetical protein
MLYHWQARGLEMFVAAESVDAARRAVIAKLKAYAWQQPARYELALADLTAAPQPFTEAYDGQVVLLDCGTWTPPESNDGIPTTRNPSCPST